MMFGESQPIAIRMHISLRSHFCLGAMVVMNRQKILSSEVSILVYGFGAKFENVKGHHTYTR
jgi:hypothetical protein